MPIIIPKNLPAYKVLSSEEVFVITADKALKQDIRALNIAIVNLMPDKIITEINLLKALSYTPLQLNINLIHMDTHKSKNTDEYHLREFYQNLKTIKKERFDGLIITGAPIETLPFNKVDYWKELKEIFLWSKTNVFSTLHLCWGAQAGLYFHYDIKKKTFNEKLFGIFKNKVINQNSLLTRGLDKHLSIPHSRWTGFDDNDILKNKDLHVLIKGDESGIHLISAKSGRQIFSQGHPEYDINTLHLEYLRDLKKNKDTKTPKNYYLNDNPKDKIIANFKGNSNLFFVNWLNFIYQKTPYDLGKLKKI